MESNVGVIHTTEGVIVPTYRGGRDAPNFTALPDIKNRVLRWHQHFDFDVSSRALMNLAGGVQTNTANAVQIELVGTCDERHRTTWDSRRAGVDYLFWPDAPDWALAELAKFVKWAHDHHGVPLRSTVTWKAYNKGQVGGSYGNNGVRLSGAQWNAYYGWLGHQHVPENDHGDPGNLNFARVLAHATGLPAKEDDGMALTDAEIKRIVDKVWAARFKSPAADPKAGDPTRAASTYLAYQDASHKDLTTRLDRIEAAIKALKEDK
jgi:hypothetical protein